MGRRVGFSTLYLIIGTAYQRNDVRERERQSDIFLKLLHFVARRAGRRAGRRAERRGGRRAGRRASYVALDVSSVVKFVLGLPL